MTSPSQYQKSNQTNYSLLFATFVIAICGLIYELLAGTVSSYLLGDSVYQFSVVIGLFMTSMGIGSFLSRFIRQHIAEAFIGIQIAIGLCGGFSAIILFYAFTYLDNYQILLFLVSVTIGSLVGCEIPLVIRLLKEYRELRVNVSNVLTVDYLGALAASLLFPIILVPQLGLFRSSLLFGIFNVLVAGLGLYTFRANVRSTVLLLVSVLLALVTLIVGFYYVKNITHIFQSKLYSGEIIFSTNTLYQNVVVTRDGDVFSLFINGNLQFNTLDEYRYHESLVHPVMSLSRRRNDILVLGGGDGMAVREVLKYPDVQSITVVDLDPVITELFKNNEMFSRLNQQALNDSRVTIVNDDAWKYLEAEPDLFDVIIVDLPDPNDLQLSKLYSKSFYKLATKHLAAEGIMVTQATSPLYTKEAFWCIEATLNQTPSPLHINATLYTLPYHAYVPTFGEWGFVMASFARVNTEKMDITVATRYLNKDIFENMREFPQDMARVDVIANTIDTHKLVHYYESGWNKWFR
ncbi:MAG: hypothetical protein AMJ53_01910 [Gammaproteobacteria bacterium SG8_11]|nr:MAG: hypothetical protein AMJ53_01910 [Gammaproteobacteria bacterium SG8_11]